MATVVDKSQEKKTTKKSGTRATKVTKAQMEAELEAVKSKSQVEVVEQPKEEEAKPVKKSIMYNDETKVVSFLTEEGLEIELSAPKTRQLVNVRKIMSKYEPDVLELQENSTHNL